MIYLALFAALAAPIMALYLSLDVIGKAVNHNDMVPMFKYEVQKNEK
jgi:hypothetical protein